MTNPKMPELPECPDAPYWSSMQEDAIRAHGQACWDAANEDALARITELEAKLAEAERDEPDIALLASMATCINHGFGMLGYKAQQSMLSDMRKCWDEVTGRGYYSPQNRDFYITNLASPGYASPLNTTPEGGDG